MAGGYQFFHEDTYARVRGQPPPKRGKAAATGGTATATSGKGKGATDGVKRSAREVLQEAIRDADAAPHVEAPQRPRVLFGAQADQANAFLTRLEVQAERVMLDNGRGHQRRQRSDTPILLGVVCSYPGPADESDPLYVQWRKATVAWLRQTYGDEHLMTVLEHADESYGHIHALVHNHGASVKPLHAGHAAASQHPHGKAAGDAYKAAERGRQDGFYAAVGATCGLSRIGPRRARLTRAQWQAQRQAERAQAEAALAAQARAQAAEARARQAQAGIRAAEAQAQRVAAQARARANDLLARADLHVAQREAELSAAQESVQKAAQAANAQLLRAEQAHRRLDADKAEVTAAIEYLQRTPEHQQYREMLADRERAEAALAEAQAVRVREAELVEQLKAVQAEAGALRARLGALSGQPPRPAPRSGGRG